MSLQVWLPLNKDLRNQGISDLFFTNDNTSYLTLNTSSTKMGGSYKSTSAGAGALYSNKKILLGNKQSMFCWVKVDSFNTSSNLTAILGQHRYAQATGMGITMATLSTTTGKLSVNTGNGNSDGNGNGGRTYNTYTGSTVLNAGTWYHVGYTYDGTTIKLYVNGKLDGSHNVPNLANPEDYLQIGGWSLSGYPGIYGGYQVIGEYCDVRIYDHTLSTKEIKELAKGLMLEYNFKNHLPFAGVSVAKNIFPYPTPTGTVGAVGWDQSLHPQAITVNGWSSGHNGGVTPAPAKGYHAYWKLIDNIPTMVFPKLNSRVSEVASASRWLGICSTQTYASTLTQDDTYTISFEAMADSPGRTVYAGYYYNGTFPDGYVYATNIPVGTWKRYTFEVKVSTAVNSGGNFYFYGHSGSDGVAYVRNVQLATNRFQCLSYTPVENTKANVFLDSSGFNYNATMVSGSSCAYKVKPNKDNNIEHYDTVRYTTSSNGSGGALRCNDLISIPDSYTIVWSRLYGKPAGHYIDWRATSGEAGVQPFYSNGTQIQYYSSAGGSAYFNYDFSGYYADYAIAVDSSSATLYVNGIKKATVSATNPAGTRANFHILNRCSGINVPSSADTYGILKVYSTKLSDEDILKEYQNSMSIDKMQKLYTQNIKEG
jgi:hypothetical protein